ncbi:DnaD domain protein [Thomasclavelia saccharogumia]|uniref:DnaD domain protein n=1 Tax=Thomasclavelia saccharogumia TaxID=341225 RepID=UPI00047C4CF2|nr:DnaD domain protein [Thomasclavelia saccharogumia]
MNGSMMSDLYTVNANYPLDSIHMRSISLLYQPLIGNMACSLYLSLYAELDQLTLTKAPSLFSRLTKITGLSLAEINEASLKLEAIGLLAKYKKDIENKRIYLYIIKTPLAPAKIFNHTILGPLLLQRLGEEELYRTKLCFKSSAVNIDQSYENVTAKFTDVFDINLLEGSNEILVEKDYFNSDYGKIESEYDLELFYQGLKDYQIKRSIITSDDETIIKQLGTLYSINALDMQGLVKDSIQNDKLVHKLLIKNCRDHHDLMMPEKFNEIYHKQPIAHKSSHGDDPLNMHIRYLESINPYQLLKDKQGGREPLKHDLQIVESIMTSLYLEPGVMNVLIELTLSQCDNVLSRAFMQSRASQWKRKKIKTVKEAIDEANLYLKYRRNNSDLEEENISMVDDKDVDETELEEFLSQFE